MTVSKKSSNRRWFYIVMLAALFIGMGFTYWKKNQPVSVNYREEKVLRGDLRISILSTGTVQPQNRLEIKAPTAGRIETVLVKEGQKVRRGDILAWMSSTERAALLDAARSKGPEEMARWGEMYRPTPILAPISGTLILRSVEPGQTFATTDAILVMSDRLTVKAQVDETDIAQIKLKIPAEIILDAYSTVKIPARVDQIAFEAKTVSNVTTYLVDVLPEKTPEFMRSGMTANVSFILDEKEHILLVPADAVREIDGKMTLLIRGKEGKPTEQEIEIGSSDGKKTEVKSGALENETVLIPLIASKEQNQNSSPFSPMGKGGRKKR